MGNYKMAFRIGTGFIVLGAVLFTAAFFMPENEAAVLTAVQDPGNYTERAVGLDISYRNNGSAPLEGASASEYVQAPMTDEEIMKRAEELGMVFETAGYADYDTTDYQPGENLGNAVNIVIRRGASALEVAFMLEEAGIVDNAVGFSNFILSENMARNINTGVYYIETGLSYSEVLRIISHSYRRRSN